MTSHNPLDVHASISSKLGSIEVCKSACYGSPNKGIDICVVGILLGKVFYLGRARTDRRFVKVLATVPQKGY